MIYRSVFTEHIETYKSLRKEIVESTVRREK